MSILVNKDTKVIVQGITGRDGSFHTSQMIEYGTNIVGGVTPGKGGQEIFDKPVFNTCQEAVEATGADVSIMYVPAPFAKAAMLDAANSDIKLLVTITEGVPTLDALEAYEALSAKGIRLIGPNCPGLITPGECKIGIMPASIHKKGRIGVISRSGTLTYEIVNELTNAGLGESTCVGIGGDPVIGSKFVDLLPLFEDDPDTDAIVIAGEIGGQDEVIAAEYFKKHMKKPVIGFMAGLTAPKGKRMGHAGAIVGGEDDTAAAKIEKLEAAGIPVAKVISGIVPLVQSKL
ncbi:MAG: succinate--CoA ligase subunit alpha [Candidatus Hydrogenedentota bacterium]